MRASPLGLSPEILTHKQKEALTLAFASGYYSIPRSITLETLASKIGIKRVAMQERLRRAELRILSHYLELPN
jgi:predicted DNA binding protein